MLENILYMVIPCYNEEEVIRETAKRLNDKYDTLISQGFISVKSRIVFVNDGSKDKTWDIIKELHESNKLFSGINLSRNRGHQNAVLAGLMTVKEHCSYSITMDADLQDDIDAIDEMVKKYYEGNDIVYGVRNSRKKDSFFKRQTAQFFYRFMKIMGVEIIYNHADFRLMSKRVLDSLEKYKEDNLFLRGIVQLIGFKNTNVYYERSKRFAGVSKYPFKKMLALALNGIFSFSVKPLKIINRMSILSFMIAIVTLVYAFLTKETISWAITICSIWIVCSLQLFGMSIIGEYIGRIYIEAKSRPRFIIADFINDK